MEKPKIPSPNRLRQNVKRNFQLATLLVLAVDLNGVAMSIKMNSHYPELSFGSLVSVKISGGSIYIEPPE
jgi:hypothetical protein